MTIGHVPSFGPAIAPALGGYLIEVCNRLQRLLQYTPFRTGLFFLPPALVMGVTSILAGRLSDLVQPRLLLALGLLVLTAVSFQFCAIDAWATGALLLGLITLRRAGPGVLSFPPHHGHPARHPGGTDRHGQRRVQPASPVRSPH